MYLEFRIMRIFKKINNNVALARDEQGRESVVFATGVGFPPIPYELTDESTIQRVFRDVDQGLLRAVSSISDDVLAAALDIGDLASAALRCDLNSNLVFTLGDHLQFAVERAKDGIAFDNPLALEVEYVYPRESEVARRGLDIMWRYTGIRLPDHEVSSIALHLVNAESADAHDPENIALIMKSAAVIEQVTAIVEREMDINVDRSSWGYVRFITHIRYLIKRLSSDQDPVASQNAGLFAHVSESFPEAYRCALRVSEFLCSHYGRASSDEETLYLMMYLNRLRSDATR